MGPYCVPALVRGEAQDFSIVFEDRSWERTA